MPYIHKESRRDFEKILNKVPTFASVGELNFLICETLAKYIEDVGGLNYRSINDCLGALEGAKLEFYRRVAAPYEEKKQRENGDVRAFEQFGLDVYSDK